jgi:hypothetical protein
MPKTKIAIALSVRMRRNFPPNIRVHFIRTLYAAAANRRVTLIAARALNAPELPAQ